jgi:hypothetical protein
MHWFAAYYGENWNASDLGTRVGGIWWIGDTLIRWTGYGQADRGGECWYFLDREALRGNSGDRLRDGHYRRGA